MKYSVGDRMDENPSIPVNNLIPNLLSDFLEFS